jgi:hypothetical protein
MPATPDRLADRSGFREVEPTLEPLLELELERVLVTHGKPILGGGREALRKALRAKPWHRRGER